jgi:hypothetical protein
MLSFPVSEASISSFGVRSDWRPKRAGPSPLDARVVRRSGQAAGSGGGRTDFSITPIGGGPFYSSSWLFGEPDNRRGAVSASVAVHNGLPTELAFLP